MPAPVLPNGETTLAYNAGTVDISGPAGVIIHGHMLLDICAARILKRELAGAPHV